MSGAPRLLEVHATLASAPRAAAAGGAPGASAPALPAGSFRPGDPATLTLHATTDGGSIHWPSKDDLNQAFGGQLAILDDGVLQGGGGANATLATGSEAVRSYQAQVLLTPGDHQVGTVKLELQGDGGTVADTAEIPPVAVHVVSALDQGTAQQLDAVQKDPGGLKQAALQALAPPRGPWDVRGPGYGLWFALLGAALLLAALGAYLWWKRQRPKVAAPALPPEAPEVVARRRLAALRAADHLSRGEHRAFHVELSDVLKEYLDGRFAWDLRDRTTDEIRRILAAERRKRPRVADAQGAILDVLNACDLVKFAKHAPARAEAEPLLDVVGRIVEDTTIVHAAEEPAQQGAA